MARSQQTFGKKEREQKRRKKKLDKAEKKEERKTNAVEGTLDNMIAYVDEFGNISDTPPDPTKKKKEIKASSIEIGVPKREDEAPLDYHRTGKVTYFNESKGYGFIRDHDMPDSVFMHVNALKDQISEGDKVKFELEKGPKGWNALNVTKG